MSTAPAERAHAGLDEAARAALARGLQGSQGSQWWSLLLGVAARSPADVTRQWAGDRFVAPCALDQRTLLALDSVLLRVAHRFEAIELSPLASGYYDGLRFMVDVHTATGERVPLIDGGLFDWLHRLAGNAKLTLVASALGSQLAATLFRTR